MSQVCTRGASLLLHLNTGGSWQLTADTCQKIFLFLKVLFLPPLSICSPSFCPFLSVLVWFCWLLSVSICCCWCLLVSTGFCWFLSVSLSFFPVFVCFFLLLSVSVCFCSLLFVSVCFCAFLYVYELYRYWCYYQHTLRDSVYPKWRIVFFILWLCSIPS